MELAAAYRIWHLGKNVPNPINYLLSGCRKVETVVDGIKRMAPMAGAHFFLLLLDMTFLWDFPSFWASENKSHDKEEKMTLLLCASRAEYKGNMS